LAIFGMTTPTARRTPWFRSNSGGWPLEVRVFSDVGLRTVWLGGKKDMGAHQQLNLVIRHWQALEDRREELGPSP
jgi:hypothetical protein